ncbi:MAG: hypothetical protein AAF525_20985 [Pseudomonadota bacterium]
MAFERKKLPDTCEALKRFPHVFSKVKLYWGYPEFLEYVDDLLTMEDGREGRRGFDADVHAELTMLKNEFMQFPDEIMSPFLTISDKNKVKEMQKLWTARTQFFR